MILSFDKPKKIRSTEEHNARYVADGAPPGVYMPNMSDEDMKKWKAKHIHSEDERVEIRKTFTHRGWAQVVIIVRKDDDGEPDIVISTNGKIHLSLDDWDDFETAIAEAKALLNLK